MVVSCRDSLFVGGIIEDGLIDDGSQREASRLRPRPRCLRPSTSPLGHPDSLTLSCKSFLYLVPARPTALSERASRPPTNLTDAFLFRPHVQLLLSLPFSPQSSKRVVRSFTLLSSLFRIKAQPTSWIVQDAQGENDDDDDNNDNVSPTCDGVVFQRVEPWRQYVGS